MAGQSQLWRFEWSHLGLSSFAYYIWLLYIFDFCLHLIFVLIPIFFAKFFDFISRILSRLGTTSKFVYNVDLSFSSLLTSKRGQEICYSGSWKNVMTFKDEKNQSLQPFTIDLTKYRHHRRKMSSKQIKVGLAFSSQ